MSSAAEPCLHQVCLLQMQLGPLIRKHTQISLGLIKTDLQLDDFASSEISKCFLISFQSLLCCLGWSQIAALCTVRGKAEHWEADPGTCETLFLHVCSFLCCLRRLCKDIRTGVDSLVQEGNAVLEAFKKSRVETNLPGQVALSLLWSRKGWRWLL